jgi:hypothetical protein
MYYIQQRYDNTIIEVDAVDLELKDDLIFFLNTANKVCAVIPAERIWLIRHNIPIIMSSRTSDRAVMDEHYGCEVHDV